VNAPRVSVLMPVRDGAQWLALAIDSVLAQTFADFELLVIDDGSSDRSPEIAADHAVRDARVRLVRQDALGLVAALNRGLREAQGDLIARLDADDLARPERLARQVAAMDANPRLNLIGSWAEKIDAEGKPAGALTPPSDRQELRDTLARTNPFVHSSVMLRTEAARRAGGYRAAFEAAEDYDLWLRLSEHGDIAIIPEPLVLYREHGGNVTVRKAARQMFSARLASRAAASRLSIGVDPADSLAAPPDWRTDVGSSFFATDARIFRFLELADPDVAKVAKLSADDLDVATAVDLNHRERKLAQIAIVHLLRRKDRPAAWSAPKLIWTLFALHPLRAMTLLLGKQ